MTSVARRWCTAYLVGAAIMLAPGPPARASDDLILVPGSEIDGHFFIFLEKQDDYFYRGLAGERLKIVCERDGAEDIPAWVQVQPRIELFDGDGVLVATAESEKKATLVTKLPATDEYMVRITSLQGGVDGYRLRLTSKWPGSASKQAVVPAESSVLFVGRPDVLLTAKMKRSGGSAGSPLIPRLIGPAGEIDLGPYLSQGSKSTRLKNVPLNAFGAYQLSVEAAGNDGDTADVVIKAKLKQRKAAPTHLDALDAGFEGTWILEGTIPGVAGSTLFLSGNKDDGTSTWAIERPQYVVTQLLAGWDVNEYGGWTLPAARKLFLDTAGKTIEYKVPNPSPALETWYLSWVVCLVDEDPDSFVYDPDYHHYLWHRSLDDAPAAPQASVIAAANHDHPAFESDSLAVVIEHSPEVTRYDVLRSDDTDGPIPAEPWRVVFSPSESVQRIAIADLDAEVDGVWSYWVRAWHTAGPSVISDRMQVMQP